jgi:serine/threonine protein kinase/tetratricopeptide (TPR) repeat protein
VLIRGRTVAFSKRTAIRTTIEEPGMNRRSAFGAEPEQLRELLSFGLEDSIGHEHAPTASLGSILERAGGRIGRYKLLSVLGEGGMGVVYLAEQFEPIRRQVALKIIKPGMDSGRVIARFEAERQALALLDYPNIAHVYDAGTTEAGRPYFVMEYVKGLPITEHCDHFKLTIADRLGLFLQTCQAVQHAHQKGIIHRDIKPSNVLVSTQDDKGVPKIIDFGIAKAISQPLTERTFYTEQGRLIGTPEYMSPEQADMNNQDVDTRTDVYSLGIVLYELLTGLLPFDSKMFRSGGIDQIRKVICEEDPRTPSTRLIKTSAEESTESARLRQTDMRTLQRELHGDLDWITLKALEKDRTRRYPTVNALTADIRNHLHHEPVSAAPPGVQYRAKKFVRRHRQRMAAIGVALLLLLALLWAGLAHVRAGRERTRAQQLEHERLLAEAQTLFETRGMTQVVTPSGEALAMIEPLRTSKHVGPEAQLLWASILVEDRRYDEAVPPLQGLCLLQDRPELGGAAHALLARIIWESGSLSKEELAEVQAHQLRAEQLLPKTAEAYYLRAMTALTMREKLDLLTEALRLDPSHYAGRRLRALTYKASRQFRLLNEDALLMTYLRPGDLLGYSLRASALRELGHPEEAVICYETAIGLTVEKAPEFIELNGRCCDVLICMGQYERALAKVQACLAIAPEAPVLHFHSFCALTALGRYDQAGTVFRHMADSNQGAGARLQDWSMKYVFDTLEVGGTWHPPDRVPEGYAFLPMLNAEATYRKLSTQARRLMTDCFSGSWSPDGTRVAFSMGVQGYSGVAVYNFQSQETDLLIVPGRDPRWSPDGRYIAFVRDCEVLRLAELTGAERRFQARASEQEEVWVMKADGTDPRRLARGGGWPSWSTDARHVYYQSRVDNTLYLISIEDSEAKPVPVVARSASLLSVSPDENYVAYVQEGALRITDLETRSRIAEWAICMPIKGGNWSPDGREFAFGGTDRFVEVTAGLWIYNVDKREASQVLTGQITAASWSSDKKRLLFSLGPPYFEIWVADLDPDVSTAEALGPARSVEAFLLDWIEACDRQLAVDPNSMLTHWARTAAALWIDDDRAELYLKEMGRAIDRCPDKIGVCHWSAMGTFGRPAVNNRVLPLTLMLVRKVVEKEPRYAREFAVALYSAGLRDEAARLWQVSKASAPSGGCRYDSESDTYTLLGVGQDIWERFDDFHFAYKALNGDGSIAARIDSVENAHNWTKVGVMIRHTLQPDSPNAMLLVTPGGVVSFQYRHRTSEVTNQVYTPPKSIQLPHWLRLIRHGNRFTARQSSDGTTWQDVQDPSGKPVTAEISMDETVYIGLAANSRNATKAAEARFAHATTTGNVSPPGPFTESCDIPRESPPAKYK